MHQGTQGHLARGGEEAFILGVGLCNMMLEGHLWGHLV